jgi:hypothetical protein
MTKITCGRICIKNTLYLRNRYDIKIFGDNYVRVNCHYASTFLKLPLNLFSYNLHGYD